MTRKKKRWSKMTTEELATATKAYDAPDFAPTVRKPSKREMAQLRRVQQKAVISRFRVALALEKDLVERTDEYALSHGITFSDVVTDALRLLMKRKSA